MFNKMEKEIKLGDKVKCMHTGFTGIAVAKTEFINGCIQWNVLPKGDKTNKMPEDMAIDEQSLKVIKIKKKKVKKRDNGGPVHKGFIRRGF